MLGVVPFGLIAGASAISAGLNLQQEIGFSVIVFAGAAQLAMISLIEHEAATAVVVLTALLINLRFVLYSASLAPHLVPLPRGARVLGSYMLTDQAYAVSIVQTGQGQTQRVAWYYLGATVLTWATWQLSTLAGALGGARLPEGLELGFAVPLTFVALLVPSLGSRASVVAALVAAGIALVAAGLPYNLGLITAALVGVAAGVLVSPGQPADVGDAS